MSTAAADRLDFGTVTMHRNLSTSHLVEMAIARGEGILAANGALSVDTGECTGRSPKDKFIVREETTESEIWWGDVNHPIEPDSRGYRESTHEVAQPALARRHVVREAEIRAARRLCHLLA